MSEQASNPSEQPYDAAKDADADPGNLTSKQDTEHRDPAEGADDPARTGESGSA